MGLSNFRSRGSQIVRQFRSAAFFVFNPLNSTMPYLCRTCARQDCVSASGRILRAPSVCCSSSTAPNPKCLILSGCAQSTLVVPWAGHMIKITAKNVSVVLHAQCAIAAEGTVFGLIDHRPGGRHEDLMESFFPQ